MNNNKDKLPLIIFCILVSILFNYFFIYATFGISVLLYNIVFLLGFCIVFRKQNHFNLKHFIIVSISIICLSFPYLRFNFELFKVLNTLLIPLFYGYLLFGTLEFNLLAFISDSFTGLFAPFGHRFFRLYNDLSAYSNNRGKGFTKVIIGLLLSFLMLIVILPLLLTSDQVFLSITENILDALDFVFIGRLMIRLIILIFSTAYIYSYFHTTKQPKEVVVNDTEHKHFDFTISIVFLAMINIVYTTFSFIQIKYLFLGITLPKDLTYARYARQGFFQLVAVTVINILLIMVFNLFKTKSKTINILLSLTVISTYIMTFSAFYRMYLYESSYGYTRLRLLVYLFLIAELIILLPVIIGIYKNKFPFMESIFVFCLAYYISVSFINIDGYIASKNVTRYLETNRIDLEYFRDLSLDAIPAMEELLDIEDIQISEKAKTIKQDKIIQLSYDTKWYEYNISNSYSKK